MKLSQVVAWVESNFMLGDVRRNRALGEMAWGVMKAGQVSFAAIGRKMRGAATEASKIARVFTLCHNEKLDPVAVQDGLLETSVRRVTLNSTGQCSRVTVSLDWHRYNTGLACALLGLDAPTLTPERTTLGPLLETFVFRELQRQASWQPRPIGFFHYWRPLAPPPGKRPE